MQISYQKKKGFFLYQPVHPKAAGMPGTRLIHLVFELVRNVGVSISVHVPVRYIPASTSTVSTTLGESLKMVVKYAILSLASIQARFGYTFEFNVFIFFYFQCMNSKITWIYCVGDNYHYSSTVVALFTHLKILKMGPTVLFTYLKIILLQCFQFLVSAKISCIKIDLQNPMTKFYSLITLILN